MKIEWPSSTGEIISADIPYPVRTYVEAVGLDAAATLFLKLGGGQIYLSKSPCEGSLVGAIIGEENASRLAAALFADNGRIPLANRFLSRYLRSKGNNIQEIARAVRIPDVTVRRYLKPDLDWRRIDKDNSHLDKLSGDS